MESNQTHNDLYELYLKKRICDYIVKKSKDITAQQLIYSATLKDIPDSETDIKTIIDRTYELGRGHGMMEAQSQMLKEIADFFGLPSKKSVENL